MKTIRFEQNPIRPERTYLCSEPGDRSGLYVPAGAALRLHRAAADVLRRIDEGSLGHPAIERLRAAVVAADTWDAGPSKTAEERSERP